MFFEKMIRPWNDGLFLRIGVVQNEDVIPNSSLSSLLPCRCYSVIPSRCLLANNPFLGSMVRT